MPFFVKLVITNLVIIASVQIGRKYPSLAGLIATMPLTSLIVLAWLHMDNPGDTGLMTGYIRGVLWGIVPTILFFLASHACLRRQFPLSVALSAGFCIWLAGAAVHQWLLK